MTRDLVTLSKISVPFLKKRIKRRKRLAKGFEIGQPGFHKLHVRLLKRGIKMFAHERIQN